MAIKSALHRSLKFCSILLIPYVYLRSIRELRLYSSLAGSSQLNFFKAAQASSSISLMILKGYLMQRVIKKKHNPLKKNIVICSPLKSGTTTFENYSRKLGLRVSPYAINLTSFMVNIPNFVWREGPGLILSDLPFSSPLSLRLFAETLRDSVFVYLYRHPRKIAISWAKHKVRQKNLRPGFFCVFLDKDIIAKYEVEVGLDPSMSIDQQEGVFRSHFYNTINWLSSLSLDYTVIDLEEMSPERQASCFLELLQLNSKASLNHSASFEKSNVDGSGDFTF